METKVLFLVLVISVIFNLVYAVLFYQNKKRFRWLDGRFRICNNLKVELKKNHNALLKDVDILQKAVKSYQLEIQRLKFKLDAMTNTVLKVPKDVTVLDENGVFLKKYNSIHQASKETGIARKTIRKYADTGKAIKGLKFKFI